ncbi:MAG: signal recognition particle protein [SAR324 cluster bacterium]|nr:signal recognition particle protein [SAR324 cluster bacterium]MCZ6629540.1 signal recognition particle protein [SAR324 cluster bacterium]MCZ6730301.1 signal recognition particle protein [SAR324 cluster bacterium]
MFEALSEKLTGALRKVSARQRLSEDNIASALQDVRMALLEADVNYKVVQAFLDAVRVRAVGEDVPGALNAGQYFIKIVSDELAEMMGGGHQGLDLDGAIPAVAMLVGLQGSGKTSTAGKLAWMLLKEGKRPYLVPADVYRPAAIEQLATLAESLGVACYPSTVEMGAVRIAAEGLKAGHAAGADVVLIDTAGRLQIDQALMAELEQIKAAVNPREILFIADGMTGQDAVNTAQAFHERLGVTGHILTKMDGDARGGAALSIRAVTEQPIKFMAVGEKLDQIEPFHPERVASRILGMGDLVTLIEKAQDTFDEEQALELQRKMSRNEFTLSDFLDQLRALRNMGSMQELLEMIPGMGGMLKNSNMDENQLTKTEAMICSMTRRERDNHNMINMSRQKRIAKGSGTRPSDVNRLLKQFSQMRKMMKKMSGLGDPGKAMEMAQSMMPGQQPPGAGFR